MLAPVRGGGARRARSVRVGAAAAAFAAALFPRRRANRSVAEDPVVSNDGAILEDGDPFSIARHHARNGCTFKTCSAVAAWTFRRDAGMPPGVELAGVAGARWPGAEARVSRARLGGWGRGRAREARGHGSRVGSRGRARLCPGGWRRYPRRRPRRRRRVSVRSSGPRAGGSGCRAFRRRRHDGRRGGVGGGEGGAGRAPRGFARGPGISARAGARGDGRARARGRRGGRVGRRGGRGERHAPAASAAPALGVRRPRVDEFRGRVPGRSGLRVVRHLERHRVRRGDGPRRARAHASARGGHQANRAA